MCEAHAHGCHSSSFQLAWTLMNSNLNIWDKVTLRMWQHLFDEGFSHGTPPCINGLNVVDKDSHKMNFTNSQSEVSSKPRTDRTPLSWAAQQGDRENIKTLLADGSDPNSADSFHWTPLHMSCYAMDLECIRMLVEAKADVNAKTRDDATVLYLVTERADRPDILHMLLEYGAEVDSRTHIGWTSLHMAALRNHSQSLRCLVEAGAHIQTRTHLGDGAITIAITNNSHDSLRILLESVSPDHVNTNLETYLDDVITSGDCETVTILKEMISSSSFISTFLRLRSRDELIRRAVQRRDCNQAWAKASFRRPDVDPVKWFNAFRDLTGDLPELALVSVDERLSLTPLKSGSETLRDYPLTKIGSTGETPPRDQLIRRDNLEERTIALQAIEAALHKNHDLPIHHASAERGRTLLEQPATERLSPANNIANKATETADAKFEESRMAINQSLVLFLLAASVIPCIIIIFMTVIIIKGVSRLTIVLARRPLVFNTAFGLLVLIAFLIQLGQWRLWGPTFVGVGNDSNISIASSRFNRGLLWITTPSFTIQVKPIKFFEKGSRGWTFRAFAIAHDSYTKLALYSSTLWRKLGKSEPLLEEGKCRVRWRCVSKM